MWPAKLLPGRALRRRNASPLERLGPVKARGPSTFARSGTRILSSCRITEPRTRIRRCGPTSFNPWLDLRALELLPSVDPSLRPSLRRFDVSTTFQCPRGRTNLQRLQGHATNTATFQHRSFAFLARSFAEAVRTFACSARTSSVLESSAIEFARSAFESRICTPLQIGSFPRTLRHVALPRLRLQPLSGVTSLTGTVNKLAPSLFACCPVGHIAIAPDTVGEFSLAPFSRPFTCIPLTAGHVLVPQTVELPLSVGSLAFASQRRFHSPGALGLISRRGAAELLGIGQPERTAPLLPLSTSRLSRFATFALSALDIATLLSKLA